MMRPIKRKPIEELYGAKFNTVRSTKVQVANGKTSNMRPERMAVSGYTEEQRIRGDVRAHAASTTTEHKKATFTSNCHLNATSARNAATCQALQSPYAFNSMQCKTTARKTKAIYTRDDAKGAYGDCIPKSNVLNKQSLGKPLLKDGCYNSTDSSFMNDYVAKDGRYMHVNGQQSMRKHLQPVYPSEQQQQQKHQHQHHQHCHKQQHCANNHQSNKDVAADDDDPEEFFELIRQTVEKAVERSVNDILSLNFHDLSSKIDRLNLELKQISEHLNRLQDHIANKVMHYGEENSRHFRYLCMKSEYDKMFYQHHAMIANKQMDSNATQMTANQHQTQSHTQTKNQNQDKSTSRNRNSEPRHGQPKSTSDAIPNIVNAVPTGLGTLKTVENNIDKNSSEMSMQEVIQYIQRFCTNMQLSEGKMEQEQELPSCKTQPEKSKDFTSLNYRSDAKGGAAQHGSVTTCLKNIVDNYEKVDGLDYQVSSDAMSTASDNSDKYEGCVTSRISNHVESAGDAHKFAIS